MALGRQSDRAFGQTERSQAINHIACMSQKDRSGSNHLALFTVHAVLCSCPARLSACLPACLCAFVSALCVCNPGAVSNMRGHLCVLLLGVFHSSGFYAQLCRCWWHVVLLDLCFSSSPGCCGFSVRGGGSGDAVADLADACRMRTSANFPRRALSNIPPRAAASVIARLLHLCYVVASPPKSSLPVSFDWDTRSDV